MTPFEATLITLLLIIAGTAIAERIRIPYPLILVIIGLVVGSIPHQIVWEVPKEWILPIFLPPILFAAARLISWDSIWDHFLKILSVSIGLVIFTYVVIGVSLHTLFPELGWGIPLLIGAILAPTDPVAATAILTRMNTATHITKMLETESLLNDAASILIYTATLLFWSIGPVFLKPTVTDFFFVSILGVITGLVLSFITGWIIKRFLSRSENQLPVIVGITLCYLTFFIAQHLHASSVLAVVAAGLYHRRTEQHILPKTRLAEKEVWNTLIFFLNGLIFVMIGLELPNYIPQLEARISLGLTIAILFTTIGMLCLSRLIWMTGMGLISNWYTHRFKKAKRGNYYFNWKSVLVLSWSGMRGLVSLALAMVLPLNLLAAHSPFPARSLIICITIGAILFTLLVQGLTLPFVLRWLQLEKDERADREEAAKIYKHLTQKAITHFQQHPMPKHINAQAAKQLIERYYENRLLQFQFEDQPGFDPIALHTHAQDLLSSLLTYERKLLHHMRQTNHISEETYVRLLQKADKDEVGFASFA